MLKYFLEICLELCVFCPSVRTLPQCSDDVVYPASFYHYLGHIVFGHKDHDDIVGMYTSAETLVFFFFLINRIYCNENVAWFLCLESSCFSKKKHSRNVNRIHNHLFSEWTLSHLARLVKSLSCTVSTYLYGTLNMCFYYVTYTIIVNLYSKLPDRQETHCSKNVQYLKFKWLQWGLHLEPVSSAQMNELCCEYLSVRYIDCVLLPSHIRI